MEITEFTIKLIIILIPGAIASLIIESLTFHKKWTPFRIVFYSILLGGLSYLFLQSIYLVIDRFDESCTNYTLGIWGTVINGDALPFNEILWACLISIFLGFSLSGIINEKLLFNRTPDWISTKFGDDSLYYFFLNSPEVYPVYIRDIKNNLTYHGIVHTFSEDDFKKEITLRDVTVYSYQDSELLYSVPYVYLSKSQNDDFIIEIPDISNEENKKNDVTKTTT